MPRHSIKNKIQQKGGSGAADYATQVYGAAGSQQAVPGSNVIAMKQMSGGKLPDLSPAPVMGGKKNKNGGNVLGDLLVPAALIYANKAYGKARPMTSSNRFKAFYNRKKSRKNRSRRFRKTSRR